MASTSQYVKKNLSYSFFVSSHLTLQVEYAIAIVGIRNDPQKGETKKKTKTKKREGSKIIEQSRCGKRRTV
jgi:hypothetical protein